MEKVYFSQNYTSYQEEDHLTWQTLMKRHLRLLENRISSAYLEGFNKLQFDHKRIIRIEEVSDRMEYLTGWKLIPVSGLIPTKEFFYMLINKIYPVTVPIRHPWEIDFSEQPDIFHDVCGHLPLLTDENFIRFLTAYSIIALKYVNNDRAVELLGRLYWFTYEMGLIKEGQVYKPYGGAIITSAGEIANVNNDNVPKHPFDLDHIFRTAYDNFRLQKEYFVIDSFDDLFNSLEYLETKLIEHLLLPQQESILRNYSLNPAIGRRFNNVIGFLNDVQFKFPDAISFAAGKPDEKYFNLRHHLSKFDLYVDYRVRQTGASKEKVINSIGQYGKTKGIINDIVSEYLKKDENISVSANHILMTVGAQEAFSIIVSSICDRDKDVILVEDPGYIGVSSFARVFGYNIEEATADEEGINLKALISKILDINRSGRKVKLLYVVPDYQNPSGSFMPIGNRLKLLELARNYNFLIIEDGIYNSYTYGQKRCATLKSLDRYNRVIYVGSFSKSLFPGLRVGLIAADQLIENEGGEAVSLIDEMAKVKAQISNNTPTINQAILGGILLDADHSLSILNRSKIEGYRMKYEKLVDSLNKYIKVFENEWASGIKWNDPKGGLFIKLTLPFDIDIEDVYECADKYKVIVCPMRYFHIKNGGEKEIRVTFSNLSPEDIEMGVSRLADYLKNRVEVLHTERKGVLENIF